MFVVLSGEGDRSRKVKLLNAMLMDWVMGKRKSRQVNDNTNGSEFHSPATLNTETRVFLASTKLYFDWHFTLDDFKFDGGYCGWFKELMNQRQRKNVSTNFCIL